MRRKHYSPKTERVYIYWLRQYFYFHKLQHPETLNAEHIRAFLTYLASDRKVSAATQSQALNALAFLYNKVLKIELGEIGVFTRPKRYQYTPTVLSEAEVKAILKTMRGRPALACALLYGTGMRINELVTLRVQDIDFGNKSIVIRNPKGNTSRVVPIPEKLIPGLNRHLVWRKQLHVNDINKGRGYVALPNALSKKMPKAQTRFEWQYVFPSATVKADKKEKHIIRRWHTSSSTIRKALQLAVRQCGINKRVTAHTLRHSFATHLLHAGTNIRTIQQLMGHKDVNTTMIYTHIAKQHCQDTVSPFDRIWSK
jgi:integron integrase